MNTTATECYVDHEAPAFDPGDKVALRSGGPGMTVLDVGRHNGLVFCRWMNPETGATFEGTFPAATLTKDTRNHFRA